MGTFQTLELATSLIELLRPLVARIRARDKKLANQIVDAANSVILNIGEGSQSDPGNARARYNTAAGSAAEVRAGLDRVIGILWRLRH